PHTPHLYTLSLHDALPISELVDRAEAVLHRTQHAQPAIGFALEIQHRINHVLQYAGPGQGAFLGHVADQEDRRAALLGETYQQRSEEHTSELQSRENLVCR